MTNDLVCFDIEATDLKASFGHVLCVSAVPIHSDKVLTFRLDEYPHESLSDDKQMLLDVRDYLENQWGWVGWNCVDPDHLTCTSDLRWVPLDEVKAGDKLLGFTEPNPRRNWCETTVLHNELRKAEVWKIRLEDDRVFYATPEHPWLVKTAHKHGGYRWTTTNFLNRNRSRLTRLLPVWETETSYDAGWLAGMFDGEGCFFNNHESTSLAITQRDGPILERVHQLLTEAGIPNHHCNYDVSVPHMGRINIGGGKRSILETLGRFRPTRLVEKLKLNDLGAIKSDEGEEGTLVVEKERVGERWISVLGTTSETYLVDGIGVHNSKLYDVPFLNARLLKHGERPLERRLHVDLMYYARGQSMRIHSSRLDAVAKFFNFAEQKTDMNPDKWTQAFELQKDAMDYVVEHCEADVKVLKAAFDTLKQFVRNVHY